MRISLRSMTVSLITLCILLFSIGSSPVDAVTESGITFGPYIQRLKKTAVSILIRTDETTSVTLRYRMKGVDEWTEVADSATTEHSFRVEDLKEGTEYQYYFRDASGNKLTMVYTFHTKRIISDDEPLRIAVFGDSGGFTTDQLRVAMQMQWWEPDVLLHTGDIAYSSGTLEEFGLKFFKPYQPLIAQVPFYGTIGNHDYSTEQGAPYKSVFETPRKYSDTEDYYAFDYGPTHIVSLNSNLDYSEGSTMYNWLLNDLAQTEKSWKIVFFHHPVWSSGKHGSTVGMGDALSPVFEHYGVQLVLNGHDHDYERNTKINGVMYVVTGGGGYSLYEQEQENPYSKVFVSEYHFLALKVTEGTLIGQAIDKRGFMFDEFELTQ